MARGQTTDQELAKGLSTVGTISSITVRTARRDSPFGTGNGGGESRPQPQEPKPSQAQAVARTSHATHPPVTAVPEQARPTEGAGLAHTDNVTVPMSAGMRSAVTLLAGEIQRRRSTKNARFTANSVYRAAIQVFLERFRMEEGERVESEEELLALARRKLALPREETEN